MLAPFGAELRLLDEFFSSREQNSISVLLFYLSPVDDCGAKFALL